MEKKPRSERTVSILSALLSVSLFSCSRGVDSPMGNWGHMMGYGSGGGFMWIIVVVLVGAAVYFMLQVMKSKSFDGSVNETSLDILKKRYAKGEIDKAEFERKKTELDS